MKAPARLERDSRISSVWNMRPPAPPAELGRELREVELLARARRVAPEARAELVVGQEPFEQLCSACL